MPGIVIKLTSASFRLLRDMPIQLKFVFIFGLAIVFAILLAGLVVFVYESRIFKDLGFRWLNLDLPPLDAGLPQYGVLFGIVALTLMAVGVLLQAALKHSVSVPITALAGTALSVIEKNDYSLRAAPYGRDEIGNLTEVVNQMLEVVEQRDLSLRKSEEKFYKAFHGSSTPSSILRIEDKVIIDMNESKLRMLGYRREEVIGHTPLELGIITYDQFLDYVKPIETLGSTRNMELQVVTKSGAKRDLLASMDTIDVGGQNCYLSTGADITELKQVEEQLRQSQKMEAIGRLAGGIAHDFNNYLTAINGYSFLALQGIEPSHPLYEYLKEILKSGEKAAGLTKQLLAYSRKQILEPKLWDLGVIVRDMQGMLERLIGEDVELVADLKSGVGLARLDRGQMEQIILNLAINARDAMPGGGRLTLETGHVILDQSYIKTHFDATPGPYLVLTVSDTGFGMTPEVKSRIFEPFFTTKDVTKGTGLGLSVVYGIVKQSGGSISVHSEPGHGTTFRVYFPEAARKDAGIAELSPEEGMDVYRGHETVLLAEDEESVRKFTREALERQGYGVLEAGNGVEALKLLEGPSPPIQLVITDLVMPEMGGMALADRIHTGLPNLPVLFVSGYPDHGFQHSRAPEAGEKFLQKPFNPLELARKVREVLEEAGNKA